MSLTINDLRGKDILPAVQAIIVEKGKTKDGNEYDYADIIFKNGWKKRLFFSSDALFGLLDACNRVKESPTETATPASLEEKSNMPF